MFFEGSATSHGHSNKDNEFLFENVTFIGMDSQYNCDDDMFDWNDYTFTSAAREFVPSSK